MPLRLERITIALLASDYVKMAFLSAAELGVMARSIELALDAVQALTLEQLAEWRASQVTR
jgi:hypothetical protein